MNTPKIRFKGFADDWEQRKLSEVAEIVGGGTPSTNIPEYWDGDIDWYAPAEINDQIYVDGSERKITKLGLEKSSAKILPADKTVLFTSRAGIGKTAILRRSGSTNQGFQSMVLNDETNPYFVFSISKFIKEEAERVASGSTFAEVSGKMLGNLAFMFPTKKEQDKIGEYFSNLDNLITLHQRKCDETKQLKKFMLQKMFPKNGEKNPEIRFEGFTDDWEQRKFGDYNDLMTGYPFESDKFSEDGIKLVRGMNVKRGYLDFSGDICAKWNSCVGLENFLLKDGDILIQMDGALIGKSYAKIKENQLPALLVQRVTRARTNNKFASQDFMYQTIQRDFLRYIEMNKTETAVPHLSLNDIRNFEIMVPCLAEQKKIGEYFDSLDNLITLHQRKCEKLKELKKYMLQNMFV